jgi:lipopolysaccharide transport system permease protein
VIQKREIRHIIDLIVVLTQKEMKVRYKNNFLGYLWSILNPLAFAFVFFVVFKVVMRIQMEDYTLFLIAGLFPWQWLSNSMNMSPTVFLVNASIIKKVNYPRNVTLLAVILQDMIHFILAIPVIIFFMFVYHKTPYLSWIYGIPLLLIIQLLLSYGICLAISSINLFFRDLERLTTIFTMFLFYCTPIIYPETMIPEKYKYLLNFNPIAPLMVSWRNLFLNGTLNLESIAVSFAYSLIAFGIGHYIYSKLVWRFAEIL